MALTSANIPHALESNSGVAWLALLTITDSQGGAPLRVVSDSRPLTSRGQVFEPYPFTIKLADDTGESMPVVTLTIANLDRAITEYIRESEKAPKIVIEIVTSAYPDIVERQLDYLRLASVTYDSMVVTGRLDVDDVLAQRFPGEAYTANLYPGLFR